MQDLSRALGYCRVSTQRQHTEGHGLERYIDRLKQYGLSDEQIYWDIESGASEKRKGYNQVLGLVRAKKVDKLIVPCFDRFTRSALGWEVACKELQDFGVELIFLDGGSLDLETPEGLFTSRILAAMAAQLRDKNKYNAIAGARYFREKRKIYKAIFGFVKDADTVAPNLKEYRNTGKSYASVAKQAIRMFMDTGEIAKTIRKLVDEYGVERLGKHNYDDFPRDISSFRRWLQNPQLCGQICYYPHDNQKRLVLESEHEGLITVDQHNEILRMLSMRPKIRHTNTNNPLTGLTFCGVCGLKMIMHSNTLGEKRYEHLRCTGHYNKPGHPKICNVNKYFSLDAAITACIRALQQRAKKIGDGYAQEVGEAKLPSEVLDLQQQIIELRRRNDPDLESAITAKEQRLESLIRTSDLNYVADATRNEILKTIASDADFWQGASKEHLATIFQELVSDVVCSVIEGEQVFLASFKI
ncbi:resolvase [Calothrix sp. HK-06]|nr:resolvase [Calothrix sp. HK-06]